MSSAPCTRRKASISLLVARRRERLESLAAKSAAEHNVRVHAVPNDLSDPARIQSEQL